jgi:hypothetical protein
MKHMDIDCYERGCACVSSSRVAGEKVEVVEVVSLRELSDDEIHEIYIKHSTYDNEKTLFVDVYGFARAILKKASEK